jgi:hypothetical protein
MASSALCVDLTPLDHFEDYQLMCIDSHSRCQIQAIALPIKSTFGGESATHSCLVIRFDGRSKVNRASIGAPDNWHRYNR